MARKNKKHTPHFKFKVVLESYKKGNVSEVARHYGLNATQLSIWRKEFEESGYQAFEKDPSKTEKLYQNKIKNLEQLIGKKEVEISLLKNYLDFYAPLDGN